MINYEYTDFNQLEKPHKYMYTSYQGSNFIDAYFRDRLKYLKSFEQIKGGGYKNKVDLSLHSRATVVLKFFFDREFSDKFYEPLKVLIDWECRFKLDDPLVDNVDDNIMALSSFNISSEIKSEKLLISLVNIQLDQGDGSLIKFWLDLLVQRFEVTKKLYESYLINFRKGEGKNDIVRIYYLFALSLTLFYCSTKSIKYLSTLLKVTDLLCSLEENLLNQNVPLQSLASILLVELLSIKSLSKTIDEVKFDFV